ncbi:hypothetical protein F5I97DRAFT_1188361 [Phlebopus sp. FC_14]|nr:hypothetical protein F5I97DRAFT_1188361 [Phlebopus sp. FC_14]
MLSNPEPLPSNCNPRPNFEKDPFVSYSQAIHDYTLKLWTESRRIAEEKARNRSARRQETSRKQKGSEALASQQLPRSNDA